VIDPWFLDQSGFAPTLPTGYSWGRLGARLGVPCEAPRGRRVDAAGAPAPHAAAGPRLLFEARRTADGPYDAAAHLAFVARLAAARPDPARPCVVVLDTYAVHHSRPVKDAIPALAERGVRFCYLPPYSPEPNPIEAAWKQVKHQDTPERGHATEAALQAAVEAALADRARKLAKPTHDLPQDA